MRFVRHLSVAVSGLVLLTAALLATPARAQTLRDGGHSEKRAGNVTGVQGQPGVIEAVVGKETQSDASYAVVQRRSPICNMRYAIKDTDR